MKNQLKTLDVRPVIARGESPCGIIHRTVDALQPDEAFRLIAPFEPRPLYSLLASRGYRHEPKATEDGWEVLFTPTGNVAADADFTHHGCPSCEGSKPQMVSLDLRGLEPPEPMVRVLERLATSKPGQQIEARTDRSPQHLLLLLKERGVKADTTEHPEGGWLTRIVAPA